MGELLNGRYQLRERLPGVGGEQLWQARDTHGGQRVLLRILTGLQQASEASFEERARTLREVDVPRLATVLDHGRCEYGGESALFLATESAEGRLLSEVTADGPPPTASILAVGAELCEALAGLHDAGLVHGSVTCDDIVVDEDDAVTLLPPSLAALAGHATSVPVEYRAPELITESGFGAVPESGQAAAPAADLYAAGCVLYALIAGRPPFTGDPAAVSAGQRGSRPEPVWRHAPLVPRSLDHLIRELLERDPELRPRGAARVASRLSALAEGPLPRAVVAPEDVSVPATPDPGGVPEPAESPTTALGIAFYVLTGVLAAATWALLATLTSLGWPAIAGITAVMVGAAHPLLTGATRWLDTEPAGLARSRGVTGAVGVAVVACAVAAALLLPLPWWAAVPLSVPIGMGAGFTTTWLGTTLLDVPVRVLKHGGYPPAIARWTAAGSVLTGALAYTLLEVGGHVGRGVAVVYGLGGWAAYSAVLAALLGPLRRR